MKQLVKLLIESLFDNDDNILDIDNPEISDNLMKNELSILQKHKGNLTQYPEGFYNIQYAEDLIDVADLFINILDSVNRYKEEKEYVYSCEFKEFSENLEYDRINIYSRHPVTHKNQTLLFHLNLIGHHIYYIQFENRTKYCRFTDGKKTVVIYITDILPAILNKCSLDEVRLYNAETQDPKKVRTYVFCGTSNNDEYTMIPRDVVENMPVFTVPNGTSGYAPICQVNKNAMLKLSYGLRFPDFETLWMFLDYFKKQGFRKFKQSSLFNIYDTEKGYKGIYNANELFDKFVQENMFEMYSFSDKYDINNIIFNVASEYCRVNLEYDGRDMLYETEWGDKGKDNNGQYVNIQFSCDYNDNDNIHRYVKLAYKFYKSGLCALDKVIDDGKNWLRRRKEMQLT